METLSALLALYERLPPVIDGFNSPRASNDLNDGTIFHHVETVLNFLVCGHIYGCDDTILAKHHNPNRPYIWMVSTRRQSYMCTIWLNFKYYMCERAPVILNIFNWTSRRFVYLDWWSLWASGEHGRDAIGTAKVCCSFESSATIIKTLKIIALVVVEKMYRSKTGINRVWAQPMRDDVT